MTIFSGERGIVFFIEKNTTPEKGKFGSTLTYRVVGRKV